MNRHTLTFHSLMHGMHVIKWNMRNIFNDYVYTIWMSMWWLKFYGTCSCELLIGNGGAKTRLFLSISVFEYLQECRCGFCSIFGCFTFCVCVCVSLCKSMCFVYDVRFAFYIHFYTCYSIFAVQNIYIRYFNCSATLSHKHLCVLCDSIICLLYAVRRLCLGFLFFRCCCHLIPNDVQVFTKQMRI